MSLQTWSRSHRLASVWVAALLAANGAVLATGLADTVGAVVEQAKPRAITLITTEDGRQIAVDPTTPEGWKAIADAQKRGDTVATVAVPADAVAANEDDADPTATIPGVASSDLQNLLSGTVDHIVTTVETIVDSTGKTVVSIVDGAGSTASSVVGDAQTTVSSVLGDTATTLQNTVTTLQNTVTTIQNTVTTLQNTVTTIENTVTTLPNTVTTIQNTVSTLVGPTPSLPPPPSVPSEPAVPGAPAVPGLPGL